MLLENKKQRDVSPVFSPVIKTGGKTKKRRRETRKGIFVIGMFGIPSSKPSVKI
jgi:hypothetical protein